ncbi:glutathione S-transferase A-like [Boleophthalmus pectinirostris]|uniref:glutathione S-transferase A-like n=1 Tax=Boleophthalmus pectinirostris TaxID=150288 RepID=UPI000A1C5FC8|nr:glutathione S-transferase A-like [Boleophthalmus pectinirostris]
MAKDMTLYWGSGSPPCWRAMIALEEKGLQGYHSKLLSFEKQEHKGPEVLKLNPRGQFPAFQHGKIIVNESFAICEYLEDTFKGQGTALVPQDPVDRAMMRQRMHEGNTLMSKFVDVAFYVWRIPEAERNEATLKRNKEALTAEVKLWEGYLQKGNGHYLAGKSFTLADVIVFPVVAMLFRLGLSEEKYPKLAGYYNHLKTRPSIEKSWPPTWKETPGQPLLSDI